LDDAPHLTELNLENNNLEGDIPWQVFDHQYLEQLRLGYNRLSDDLDTEDIGDLKELKILSIEKNHITGTLPEILTDCQLLHTLRLNGNKLTGSLPSFLQEMTSLASLDLADNEIAGTLIPFDKHRDLRRLDLSFNHIAGTVPSTFLSKVDKESFQYASLRRNFIFGAIPPVLAGLDVGFQDNLIDSIDLAIYDSSLGGSIEAYGSSAILFHLKHGIPWVFKAVLINPV